MPVYTWVALGLFMLLGTIGLVAAVRAFVRSERTAGALGARLEAVSARLDAKSQGLAESSERLAVSQERLAASLASLQEAREQVDTLRFALAEPLRLYRLARSVIPRR